MSSQTVPKPTLQGVRIKARKGAVKAQAKHEPAGKLSSTLLSTSYTQLNLIWSVFSVFRDQLYKHLETVPENDFDSFATKLVQAGSTLEFLKYADALFEILLVGGLIQPGGSYVDDGAPVSPFTVFNAKEPANMDDIKKYIEVLNKLIRRCDPISKRLISMLIVRWRQVQISSETSRGISSARSSAIHPSLVACSEG